MHRSRASHIRGRFNGLSLSLGIPEALYGLPLGSMRHTTNRKDVGNQQTAEREHDGIRMRFAV